MGVQETLVNYLSIDVEDYFHVSAFEGVSPPGAWDSREMRVERNTEKILGLLNVQSVKATFFVLGWVAKRCPGLVGRIVAEGHELASHGYGHQRLCHQTRQEFKSDIRRSKQLLEDISGHPVIGYRAPSYSISRETFWAFDELWEAGYRYDSSIFPVRHDFYGVCDWPRFATLASKDTAGQWQAGDPVDRDVPRILEVPVSTVRIGRRNLPVAGGGYFRLYPYAVTRWGLRRINQAERQPFVFYLHPWEMDPDQPRMAGAGLKSRLRHYLNLKKTEARFKRLLNDFKFTKISENPALISPSPIRTA